MPDLITGGPLMGEQALDLKAVWRKGWVNGTNGSILSGTGIERQYRDGQRNFARDAMSETYRH